MCDKKHAVQVLSDSGKDTVDIFFLLDLIQVFALPMQLVTPLVYSHGSHSLRNGKPAASMITRTIVRYHEIRQVFTIWYSC